MDYDKTDVPKAYDPGRAYGAAQLGRWLALISDSVAAQRVDQILDLGCGTGRYSIALSDHFGADVVALDPSAKMLAEARKKAGRRVGYVRGRAEELPLSPASFDLVLISMVFHHFDDPAEAVRQCRRVLKPAAHQKTEEPSNLPKSTRRLRRLTGWIVRNMSASAHGTVFNLQSFQNRFSLGRH